MNEIPTEEMNMDQANVGDLPEGRVRGPESEQKQQDVVPFSVWNLGVKSNLRRTDIYERV